MTLERNSPADRPKSVERVCHGSAAELIIQAQVALECRANAKSWGCREWSAGPRRNAAIERQEPPEPGGPL